MPLEEGNWLDKFAFELGSTYECGSKLRDRSQLGPLGISRDEFYQWFGEAIHDLILNFRGPYVEHANSVARLDPTQINPSFQLAREATEPKQRWADGTPEHSLCIYGLLKLFPGAKFIHIARDVRSVVRSLVKLSRDGVKVVNNEREAYEYWLRTTRACVRAEKALGAARVFRVRYTDLVENPVHTFTVLFDFLAEPFCAHCLEPLATRINSSRVPPEFDSRDGTTPASLFEEAEILSDQLQRQEPISSSVEEDIKELENEFWDRVRDVGNLEAELERAIRNYFSLDKELASRTEWALKPDKELAARDETIRQYQDELKRRTITNGLWRLWQLVSREFSTRR